MQEKVNKMQTKYKMPIPGQSLTSTPKNAPYENPPEIVDPEEALEVHLMRLTEKKRMAAALDMLETGIDLQTLVEGILRSAVMNGIHTIDVGLIIAPVIHEYIKITADEVGIDYDEGFDDDEDEEMKTYVVASERAKKKLKSMGMMSEDEPTLEEPEEDSGEDMPEEDLMMEEEMTETKPKGLMSREGM